MDSLRYYLALVLLVTVPPGIIFWYLVHPFIGFWRSLGPTVTYLAVGLAMLAMAVGLFWVRRPILNVEFGTHYWLCLLALLLSVPAGWIEVSTRRQLKLAVLAGLPELRPANTDRLLTEGIYAKIRHPRYLGIILAFPAWALLANYLAIYLLCPLVWLGIGALVRLEERELVERFGEAYRAYSRRVPRFIPRNKPLPTSG